MELTVQELLDNLREKYLKEEDVDKKEKILSDAFIIHSRRQEVFFENLWNEQLEKISEWYKQLK